MKKTFTTKEGVELAVRQPTSEERTRGKIEYNKAVKRAIEEGHILRAKLEDYVTKQGLWNDEMESKDKELLESIDKATRKLRGGNMTLSEAKKLCFEIMDLRSERLSHIAVKSNLDNITAEAFGEQAQFDYLVSVCTVYNDTGKPYFKDVDDYKNRSTTPEAFEAANNLSVLLYNIQAYQESLPENKFLKKFGFVDEKYRLIRKDGKLVDREGRLINDEGYYINEEGKRVNISGELVNEEGEPIVEELPFLDDDGKPIAEVKTETKVETEVVEV